MAVSTGTRLGPYEILVELGAGGMGEVYRARDTRLGRQVAVKVLPRRMADNAGVRERFEREAQAISSLNHPNVCTLYDVGHEDGVEFLVMEFMEGETLAEMIRRGPVPLPRTLEIACQAAAGLAAAHAHGIVHRDIKPSNVMVTAQGPVKIIDFGVARFAEATAGSHSLGATIGTIGYMSPEQTLGKPVDARTDVWALGLVIAEMLTGKHCFQRDTASAVIFAILNEPPPPIPQAPSALQKIIYRALSKDSAARYDDAGAMAKDLQRLRGMAAAGADSPTADFSAVTADSQAAEVQRYLSAASGSAWAPARATSAARASGKPGWWVWALTVAAVALLIAAFAARRRIPGFFSTSTQDHIAVLPFENIGGNPADAPLAAGLMESLTSELSNLDAGSRSLWVVPASVVTARKVSDPTAALRQLGANLVVQGSIERDGRDIHLTVNLIDAKSLRQVGSAQLEDQAGDLATLQNEAVARLAKLMNLSFAGNGPAVATGSAAYESYLTALGYVQRWDKPGNLDRAIASLNQAVQADPTFAVGYAELGEAYRLKYSITRDTRWIAEATANCTKAMQLDDRLPAAYITLARIHDQAGNHNLALQEFQHALSLDARDANALTGMAQAYENAGRIADAESAFRKAVALRPDYWDGYNSLGLFYDRNEKFAQAIPEFQRAAALTPDNATVYNNLAAAYLDMRDPKLLPRAEQALKQSLALSPGYAAYANLGVIYLTEKRYAESVAMTEKALAINGYNYLVWDNLVGGYEWLNQEPKARSASDRELALLLKEAQIRPRDAQVQMLMAQCYARQKRAPEALLHLDSALALAPGSAQMLEGEGEVYERLGNRAKAIRYIRQAMLKGYPLAQLQLSPAIQNLVRDPNFLTTLTQRDLKKE
jgi:tetratricopeptide (TPR) repeat protein/predicted Ser/Thr protein kinase